MKLARALRYARRYRNWREMLAARAAGRNPARVELRDGTVFEAPPDVNAARAINGIVFRRCFTPRGFELRPGETVVDVGANIGVFSVYAGRTPGVRVVAVEPAASNLACLERNLRANGCGGTAVFAGALADRPGPVRLFRSRNGVLHRIVGGEEPGGEAVEVPAASLEQLLDEQGVERVDLLKMDCEGAEGLVLGSAPKSVLERVRRIAMEFHDDASPLSHEELRALLEAQGFSTFLRWDGRSKNGFLFAQRPEPASG